MKILVCYKIVPDDQDIAVNNDLSINLDKAELKISLYDLNAIEAGVDLIRGKGSLVGISVGDKKYLENSKMRKNALSRGPDSLTLLVDDSYGFLTPQATAYALSKVAAQEGFDLILCGEGSGDRYSQQVGTLLGEYLGVPNIAAVSKMTLGTGSLTVERVLESEVELLEVPLPAVISVSTEINTPQPPSMKNILAAGKKPVKELCPADLGLQQLPSVVETVSVLAPEQADRLGNIVDGDSDDHIAAFIENIRKTLS